MIGNRLRKANLIAKKRFKRKFWNVPEPGCLRKNNTVCSCEMCRNPRRCSFTPKKERPTIQERRAPTIKSFDLSKESDSRYYDPEGVYEEQYWKDVEWFMMLDLMKEENNAL